MTKKSKNNLTTLILILVLFLLVFLAGYNYYYTPLANYFYKLSHDNNLDSIIENSLPIPTPTASFTVEQKVRQILVMPLVIDDELDLLSANDDKVLEKLVDQQLADNSQSSSITKSSKSETTTATISPDEEKNISQAVSASSISAQTRIAELANFNPGAILLYANTDLSFEKMSFALKKLREQLMKFATLAQSSENQFFSNDIYRFQPLFMADHESGLVSRFLGVGFTHLPVWSKMCKQTIEKNRLLLASSSAELASVGIDWILGPTVDLDVGHAVNRQRFCVDQKQLFDLANLFVTEFAKKGILTTLKHYPGIGNASKDLHISGQAVEVSLKDLEMFSSLLDLYPNLAVMSAHLQVDGQFDNIPCSLSADCLSYLMRTYPEVILVSDALEMKSATNYVFEHFKRQNRQLTEREVLLETATLALKAGNHLLLFGKDVNWSDIEFVAHGLTSRVLADQELSVLLDQAFERITSLKK